MDYFKALPPSDVYTLDLTDGTVAWMWKHPSKGDKDVRTITSEETATILLDGSVSGRCNQCVSNASVVARLSGPGGPLLLSGIETMPTCRDRLYSLREKANEICANPEHEMVLICDNTLPPCECTGQGGTTNLVPPFYHLTAKPGAVTTAALAARLAPLWSKITSSVLLRVSKFLSLGARATMITIEKEIMQAGLLKRPDYWAATVTWILAIQKRFPLECEDMTTSEKEALCIFAMSIGTVNGPVHYNFQSSANFIDFMIMESIGAISTEMDKRSDPSTNQVSQLARTMAAKGVTFGKWVIGLMWDGKKFRDDLDLYIDVYRNTERLGRIYYGAKHLFVHGIEIGKQDFDAGISGHEAEPAENVTFTEDITKPGMRVVVSIDNYTRRTTGADIPCTVLICQQGNPPIEITAIWPKQQVKGNLVEVAEHIFTPIVEAPVEMSDTQARAAAAQDSEWKALFGVPTSTVATIEDLCEHSIPFVRFPPPPFFDDDDDDVVKFKMTTDEKSTFERSAAAEDMFSSVIKNASGAGGAGGASGAGKKKEKTFLSDRIKSAPPSTMTEFFDRVQDGTLVVHTASIHLPDHPPGYIVNIGTIDALQTKSIDRDGQSLVLSPCHYEKKGYPPIKPDTTGNARLDADWISGYSGEKAHISSISKIAGKFFISLYRGILPTGDAWPHSAGFYPQDLTPQAHKHRSKWAFMNSAIKPTMTTTDDKESDFAIGTFLTSQTATLFVNGEKIILKVF